MRSNAGCLDRSWSYSRTVHTMHTGRCGTSTLTLYADSLTRYRRRHLFPSAVAGRCTCVPAYGEPPDRTGVQTRIVNETPSSSVSPPHSRAPTNLQVDCARGLELSGPYFSESRLPEPSPFGHTPYSKGRASGAKIVRARGVTAFPGVLWRNRIRPGHSCGLHRAVSISHRSVYRTAHDR